MLSNAIYAFCNELFNALAARAHAKGYNIVLHDNYKSAGKIFRTQMRYAKKGVLKQQPNVADTYKAKKRKTSTKGTNCPWITAFKRMGAGWVKVPYVNLGHNHPLADNLAAFTNFRRKSLQICKERILALWKARLRPLAIMQSLRAKRPKRINFTRKNLGNFL
ncbi:hypothetical protein GGTG_05635 [Gaeumannomyces tritici R3-111a-1]|uniref:FAR1 domain-containing protein n=1 Tax=Gaeumannomyces tritici (strain R3-111a-1) TaxID=644352 RepID=J3NWH1_GAET3|nr:hypothetical protein GGTG_05635 [Gaeumannomyces tritici R3-111a-1]EJT75703.1 hypothetical protein GGTG_05635 [Gaeumannomyces tritici R3-111a-1]